MKTFELTKRALADLQSIWAFVANDSVDAADCLPDDFYGTFNELVAMPRIWAQARGPHAKERPFLAPALLPHHL